MNLEASKSRRIEVKDIGPCVARLWTPKDGPRIFDQLEHRNWPPWLAASSKILSRRAEVFPEGQLIIESGNKILATLSTNRFNWDGVPENLPSWDIVAGKPPDFSNTYVYDGNTLDLVSINVNPKYFGKGLPRKLIELIKEQAKTLGITHLIGDFRPNEFGKFKTEDNNWQINFKEYCDMTNDKGLPKDSWLRNLTLNGMQPIIVDRQAMRVTVDLDTFKRFKTSYNQGMWKEVQLGIWECGELGQWYVDETQAVYIESNLWGRLPM